MLFGMSDMRNATWSTQCELEHEHDGPHVGRDMDGSALVWEALGERVEIVNG